MNAPKELVRRVDERLRAELTRLGFGRRGRNPYTLPLHESPDIVGWLGDGHSVARGDGALRIGINVGVVHRPLQKLVAELDEMKYHTDRPPTLLMSIGYVLPERKFVEYEFWTDRDDGPELARLLADLESHGIPYIRSMASLDAIIDYLSRPNAPKFDAAYRLPACYLLRGDSNKANATLDRFLKDEKTMSSVIPEDYYRFATRFRALAEARQISETADS